ncbi:MAG: GGDEF domain-containing protein [Polyangiales bacterium]
MLGAGVLAAIEVDLNRASTLLSGRAERDLVEAWGRHLRVAWLALIGGSYAALTLAAWLVTRRERALVRRIERVVSYADTLGSAGATALPVDADDALGRLITTLNRVNHDHLTRESVRRNESASGEQLSRVQRAMGWVDTEDDAKRVVARALYAIAPQTSAELLMADSSHSQLLRVVQSRAAAAPGCTVDSPEMCPAAQRGVPLSFDDSESLDACPKLHDREKPCRALCIPVLVQGRSVGVLHLTRAREQEFAPATSGALEALTTAFGTRVGMLRALGIARLQAATDPLTGLLNRRSLEEKALHVFASCRSVVVVMGDLDHFKRLNDEHGHSAGDAALQGFAQVLKAALRPGDVVARYGGEEFTLLVPNATGDEAIGALDRVREALARNCASVGGPRFTVSFGASVFPRHGADLSTLLKVADAALYRAKQEGRDRAVLAE